MNTQSVSSDSQGSLVPDSLGELTAAQRLIRNSFHHLIGDLWLHAMVNKRLNLRDVKANPLIYMIDDDVPLPNERTALAWILACESGMVLKSLGAYPNAEPYGSYSFVLPESIAPRYYAVQDGGIDGRDRESIHLPAMANFRGAIGQKMREALVESGAELQPTVVEVRNGQINQRRFKLPIDLDYKSESISDLLATRDSLMRAVVSRPRVAMDAYRLTLCTGMHLRAWTNYGLAVRTIPDSMPWLDSRESVMIVPGTTGFVSPYVPRISPHVWFGFSPQRGLLSNNRQARVVWAAAYVAHRMEALAMFQAANVHYQVPDWMQEPNPDWKAQLTEAGLIQTAKAPTRSEIANRAASSIQDLFRKGENK